MVEALRDSRAEKDRQLKALRTEKQAEIDQLKARLEKIEAMLAGNAAK